MGFNNPLSDAGLKEQEGERGGHSAHASVTLHLPSEGLVGN